MRSTLRAAIVGKQMRPWWTLVAATAVICFAWLGSSRALTDHEALMAGSAKQMVAAGDWLLLKIGDRPWLEKPPLPQWLAASSAIVFRSFNEWTMRLPFAVAGVIVVLLVARIMTRLFGETVGLLSGAVQASSVYQVTYSRLAEADVVLQVFVLGAICLFQEMEQGQSRLTERQKIALRLAFWACIGLTSLSKGIAFGAVLALWTCAGGKIVQHDWNAWRRWWSPVGIPLALAITFAWPLAVIWRDPDVLELWRSHTLGRAAGSLGYTEPWWYYLTTWPVQLLPWTPIFLVGVPSSWKRAWQDPRSPERFLWWWGVSQIALLSLSSGKHHHYLIYALPAFSAVTAQGLLVCARWMTDARRSMSPWWQMLIAVAAIEAAAGIAVASWKREWEADALVFGFGLAMGSLSLAVALRTRNPRRAWITLCLVFFAGLLYVHASVLPRRDPSAQDRDFLARVETLIDRQTPLVVSGSQEIARHIFYVHRPVIGVWDVADVPGQLESVPRFYIITRGHAAKQLCLFGRVEQLAQSKYTRREQSADDRYTLYRVDRASSLVGLPSAMPIGMSSSRGIR